MAEVDPTPTEDELKKVADQLDLVAKELDREMALYEGRSANVTSRAGVLVAAAGVLTAVQVTKEFLPATIATLIFSFLAAVAGITATFPAKRRTLDMKVARAGVLGLAPNTAKYELIDQKILILSENEKGLNWRGWVVVGGYISLALSVAFALWFALTPKQADAPTPSAWGAHVSEEVLSW